MNSKFKKLLAFASLAFVGLGSLFTPTPANAVVTEVAHGPFNGVTCLERVGGAYPEDGLHFYYCGSDPNIKLNVVTAANALMTGFPQVKSFLSGRGSTYYIFQDAVQEAKYFKGAVTITDAEKQAAYASKVGYHGYTNTSRSVIYERMATGAYPNTSILSSAVIQETFFHESGHAYDLRSPMFGTGSDMARYVRIDQNYMDAVAQSPNGSSLRSTFGVQLSPTTQPPPANSPEWAEIWAEEFATRVIQQTGIGAIEQVNIQALNKYFQCSRAYVHAKMANPTASPTQADFDALDTAGDPNVFERCTSGIYCFEQGKTLNNYPLDGNNVNGATHAYRCNNFAAVAPAQVKPSDARNSELFVSSLQNLPPNVKTRLKAQNVKYFYFNNRDEANTYFQTYAPYKVNSATYVTSTAICGNTAYLSNGTGIVVSMYDNCSYSNPVSTPQNPNLRKTSYNQSGIAFGAASSPATPTFTKSGFTTLFGTDKTALTPTNWSTMTQAQRYGFLCNMFGTSPVSALEKQKGASTTPTGTGGAVCVGGTPDPLYQPSGNDPEFVSTLKMLWIMNSAKELWAEAFLVTIDTSTSPASYMPIVDRAIGSFQTPTPRAFNCTRAVIETYVNSATVPTSTALGAALTSAGCNSAPGPL